MKGVFTSMLLGGFIASVGLTGIGGQQSAGGVEVFGPPPGYVAHSADVQHDVALGLQQLDSSMRELPGYAVKVAEQVEQHGAVALMYDNPELRRIGNSLGEQIGSGLRHLAIALGKDLVATSQAALGSGSGSS